MNARRLGLLGLGLVAALLAAAWSRFPARRGPGEPAPAGPAARPDAATAELAWEAPPEAERAPTGPASAPPAAAAEFDAATLLDRLRAVHAAYEREARAELEGLLTDLLRAPDGAERTVDWLARAEPARDGPACLGAVLFLEAAIAVRDRVAGGGGATDLVAGLLKSLPALPEELGARLVAMLVRVQGPRGPVLDARFLGTILEERSQHPDAAELYVPLLAGIAESITDPARRQDFQRLFLEESEDPLLVKCALDSLLSSTPEAILPAAEDLYLRSAGQPRLRSAIAQAVACSAPVDLAASALARLADENLYAAFAALGSRPGAADALSREYDALLAAGGNATARRMLVSGLREEPSGVLLGIARLDPDPRVALQAALTLSVRGPVDETVFGELRALLDAGAAPGDGTRIGGAALVAENVLLQSSGAVRDQARDWLSEIVRDARRTDAERLDAYGRVRPWVPAGTFAGVVVAGRSLP